MQHIKRMTTDEFADFVNLPENEERLFELIDGEAVEKVPSNAYASNIAGLIIFFLRLFLREHQIVGYVTGEAGGYMVGGERYAPDVAYISKQRQSEIARLGYNPNPPELAVEVETSTSTKAKQRLQTKMANYLAVGTLTWVVYPKTKTVEVHTPGKPMRLFGIDDVLDGSDVLPGFTLAVRDLFTE
jgi:Uma2 family endonuclease